MIVFLLVLIVAVLLFGAAAVKGAAGRFAVGFLSLLLLGVLIVAAFAAYDRFPKTVTVVGLVMVSLAVSGIGWVAWRAGVSKAEARRELELDQLADAEIRARRTRYGVTEDGF